MAASNGSQSRSATSPSTSKTTARCIIDAAFSPRSSDWPIAEPTSRTSVLSAEISVTIRR